jgi:hypothetical protein
MSRPRKLVLSCLAALAVAVIASACGTEKISVSQSPPLHNGAVLFSQRCGGCHTLSVAATHGSAANVRTSQYNNGPNFDIRCERPVSRVLYAIQNGGFSGAIMPQNIVIGQDALEVAKFVATYAGSKAPFVPGVVPCKHEPIGTIPTAAQVASLSGSASAAGATQNSAASGSTTSAASTSGAGKGAAKTKATAKNKKKTAHP